MNSRYFTRFALCICLTLPVAGAQARFHVGVEAGIPLTETLMSTSNVSTSSISSSLDRYNSVTKRLLIGPAFRLELEHGLGIEFDALYQRVNYDHAVVTSSAPFFSRSFEQATANRWQFPLLIQYRWNMPQAGVSRMKPFVEAGPSISRIAGSRSTTTSFASSTALSASNNSSTSTVSGSGGTWAGVTIGGGVDLTFFRGHLRPEFRFSHWFLPNANSTSGQLGPIGTILPVIRTSAALTSPEFRPNQNEASFLLGFTF